jgi:predicted amidohydrolase YtcJ
MTEADLVLKNARVITVDPRRPTAELVAVKGDRIRLVGSNDSVESVKGAKTRVIDCQGKTVVPGFIDAHCHVFSFIRKQISLDLSLPSVRSMDDIKALIRQKAQQTPAGQWIIGSDYNDF